MGNMIMYEFDAAVSIRIWHSFKTNLLLKQIFVHLSPNLFKLST